jgi:hypothetical protein
VRIPAGFPRSSRFTPIIAPAIVAIPSLMNASSIPSKYGYAMMMRPSIFVG